MKKVFVSGCYDIVHGGHIEFFTQAKKFGDYLIVSVANDKVLELYKGRKSSLPIEHKVRLLKAISIIDEVVVGDGLEPSLDFKEHFLRIKPDYLVATEDDKFGEKKKMLCAEVGAQYVVIPKTLSYEKISTTEIINFIKAPKQIPLRVDFAGGWLDVPKFSRAGGYIVNCAISPLVSLSHWEYEIKSGLGGSAAYSVLMGKNAIETELNIGVGWQDPAIISETGLCVWRSGEQPMLEMKINPSYLFGKMALYWTGTTHFTPDITNRARNYELIREAGAIAADAIFHKQFEKLWEAVNMSYQAQLQEGMPALPDFGEIAKKYCGGGWGGYALYIFNNESDRNKFLTQKNSKKIEPYIEQRASNMEFNNAIKKTSKIYVAGHTGLVGSAIVRALETQGYTNIVKRTHDELDLTDQKAVSDFFEKEKPEYVYLAAAKVGGIYANNTYPADFIFQNIQIEANVIQSSYKYGVKKLLFLGSTCIYPKFAPQPMKEEHLLSGGLEPTNEPYAIAKIAGIKMCQSYNRQYGTNFIACMPTNLYGTNDNFHPMNSHVIPALLRKFHEAKMKNEPSVIAWGTGSAVREFLDVDDLARACLFLMENFNPTKEQNEKGDIFVNIGTGAGITIKELTELIKDVVGYQGQIVWDTTKPDGTPKKISDVSRIQALGWIHKTSLQEGLLKAYAWYLHSL